MTQAEAPPTVGGMTADEVILMFKGCGALLEGHFLLSSGLHSSHYLQCARLLMDPGRAAAVCSMLKDRLAAELPDVAFEAVIAPAMGGIILGYELARQMGVASMFVERVEGSFALRRGFELAPGTPVLLAEDVVTTGLSSRECAACIAAHGGRVAAAVCLVDRSGGRADLGVPLVPLARLDLPTYDADRLPPTLRALPVTKPGSRHLAKSG